VLKKKKLRSYIIISIFLHIVFISTVAMIYKNDSKIIVSKIFEISTIKLDSANKKYNTVKKSDVVNVQSKKIPFDKKPLQQKSGIISINNQNKEIPKKPNIETYSEQNNRIDNVSIAKIEPIGKREKLNLSFESKNKIELAHPHYSINQKPDYPLIARRRGFEGTVLLRVLVLENGEVGKVDLEKSSKYQILDSAAIKAVNEWSFIPGKKDGVVLASWVKVPIKFRLNNN
jgi:TonB family protein